MLANSSVSRASALHPRSSSVALNLRRPLRRAPLSCSASAAPAEASSKKEPVDVQPLVDTLRKAAKAPGTVPAKAVLKAIVQLEKAKAQPNQWAETLVALGARWRLIYTAPSKDVTAAVKGQNGGAGTYVPINACQVFSNGIFENGIFLGPVGSLTFKGPYTMKGKNLYFDVTTMSIGLGPWRGSIPLKKETPLDQMPDKDLRALPFFIYAWLDQDIIVGRGRSGGVALWVRADTDWLAKAGVLTVYK